MQRTKQMLKTFLEMQWYFKLLVLLLIALLIFVTFKWLLPLLIVVLFLLLLATEGELFSILWNKYKRKQQSPTNQLAWKTYAFLTEEAVSELPLSTLSFRQGVEFADADQGIFFIHLKKEISDELFADFETEVRQFVQTQSFRHVDAVLSQQKKEPFFYIMIRFISHEEMNQKSQQPEEDF